MANANQLWWIIIYLLPESLRAIDQVQVINGKLDPKWSKYISDIAGDYDESPPGEVTTPPSYTTKTGWSLTRFGESNFVAVIHRNTSTSPSQISLDAGNACGGAVVTRDQIITICGCLATWHNWMRNGAKGKLVPGSVRSKYDIIAEQIHVTHPSLNFIPNFKTKLNNIVKGLPSAHCPTNADDSDARMVDVLMVKFAPAIEHQVDGQFMPWPPYPIIGDKDQPGQPLKEIATVMGYGMMARHGKKFWNEFGTEISINISTVKFWVENAPYSDCAKNPNLWKTLPEELSTKVTCFRATNRSFELCGGLVGNPVMLAGSIHGLMMSDLSCGTSTSELLAFSFDSKTRDNIEHWAGEDLHGDKKIEYSNEESDGKSKQVIYRDFEPLWKLNPHPHSIGVTPVPDYILGLVLPLTIPSSLFAIFSTW